MRVFVLVFIVSNLIPLPLHAEQLVTTDDGRTVVLETDGSWRYSPTEERGLDQPLPVRIRLAEETLRWDSVKSTKYAQRAVVLAEQQYGESIWYLGIAYVTTKDFGEARRMFEKCSEIFLATPFGNGC